MKRYLLFAACFLFACQTTPQSPPVSNESSAPAPISSPTGFGDRVDFKQAGLFPEGIDYASNCQCFLVSSVRTGKIGQVKADGSYSVLVDDPEIISAIGIFADNQRNRLLIAISDQGSSSKSSEATQQKIAKLGIYDLSTGERQQMIDLGVLKSGAHFANDIAVDDQGNAYITDSKMPLIYRVTPAGEASIFVEHPDLGAAPEAFGLNGIVFHPDGYLIAAKAANQSLYKIPIADPNAVKKVTLDPLPASPDGLELLSNGQLVVISNAQAKASRLGSGDNWASAKVEKQVEIKASFPTTAAQLNQDLYVLEAKLGQASQGESVVDFSIQKVVF